MDVLIYKIKKLAVLKLSLPTQCSVLSAQSFLAHFKCLYRAIVFIAISAALMARELFKNRFILFFFFLSVFTGIRTL